MKFILSWNFVFIFLYIYINGHVVTRHIYTVMRIYIILFCFYIKFWTPLNAWVAPIVFDCSLLSPQGMLTEQSLPLFLQQAYYEQKIRNKDFNNEKYLQLSKLIVPTTFYTLQIFIVTCTRHNDYQSVYIVKETKNGAPEAEHLQALSMHPQIKKLIVPATSPPNLPNLIVPFAYLSYRNQNQHIHHVTIMPAASGISLAALIKQFRDDQSSDNAAKIAHAYNTLGRELGSFHQQFMMVHGDLHCSNIFYDETEDHCTFIDNETMAKSLKHQTDASIDIVRLFFDFFSVSEISNRKNFIKGIDLATWHDIALKNFIEGYVNSYQPNDRRQALLKLRIIFNTDYNFSWFKFRPFFLQQLRENYINPIFNNL